jgi:hypothetical protein
MTGGDQDGDTKAGRANAGRAHAGADSARGAAHWRLSAELALPRKKGPTERSELGPPFARLARPPLTLFGGLDLYQESHDLLPPSGCSVSMSMLSAQSLPF